MHVKTRFFRSNARGKKRGAWKQRRKGATGALEKQIGETENITKKTRILALRARILSAQIIIYRDYFLFLLYVFDRRQLTQRIDADKTVK